MSNHPRIFFMHNVISPYRLPVFEEVAQIADIEVFFCTSKTSDRQWNTSLKGYHFKHKVLPNFRIGPFFFNPTLLWRLMFSRYDMYLVGDFPEMACSTFLTILIAKINRKPVILWSETIDNNVIYYQHLAISTKYHHRTALRLLNRSINIYRRVLLASASTYVALSNSARQFLITEGVKPRLILTGPQVLPAAQLAAPNQLKIHSPYAGKTVILYLGYFNVLKGIDDLIAAMSQVSDPNTVLLIAGAGPEEQSLKALASTDRRIMFLGYTDSVAKANLMTWADIFVLPTLADCWGLVINESLHYGTPVITTSAAGAAQLIEDGTNGLLITPRDRDTLSAKLNLLISDPALLAKLKLGAANQSSAITDSRVGAKPIIEAILSVEGKS